MTKLKLENIRRTDIDCGREGTHRGRTELCAGASTGRPQNSLTTQATITATNDSITTWEAPYKVGCGVGRRQVIEGISKPRRSAYWERPFSFVWPELFFSLGRAGHILLAGEFT